MLNHLIGLVFFYQKKFIKIVLIYMIFVELLDNIADDENEKIEIKKKNFKNL